jgi:hypothetical protein
MHAITIGSAELEDGQEVSLTETKEQLGLK